MKNKLNKVVKSLKVKGAQAALLAYSVFAPINVAFANGNANANAATGADAKWNAVINFLLPWIQRLGGVVILIGAIEFGLAFKSDDAEGKTKGLRTVIAGCIVFAVGLSSNIFLAP